MRTQSFGKTLAAQKRCAQLANHRAQSADIGIAREQLERVVEARAGL